MATASILNTDLVDQFIAVTGADRDVASSLLEACAGDLDMAVGMHMDSGGADVASTTRERRCSTINNDRESDIRAPIPQKTEVLVEDDTSRLAGTWRTRRHRQRPSVFDAFRNFQTEAYQYDPSLRGKKSTKKRNLEELFRPPVDITVKGTFKNAKDVGSAQNKWLLVNVQNVQEFDCQLLNRDVWSSVDARAIIKDNFVFWQVYNDSEEGEWFKQYYKLSKWPYVAIVDPFTGEKQINWEKVSDGRVFCELAKEFLSNFPVPDQSLMSPSKKRLKMEPSILDASEQEQMEAAIKASMAENQAKASSPQYVFDSDSEAEVDGISDEVETFSDSDDIIVSSPPVSNGVPVAKVPASSTAPLANRSNSVPKNKNLNQQLPSSQPSSSSSVSTTSSSSSLHSGNSIRRVTSASNFESHSGSQSDAGTSGHSMWAATPSSQLGHDSPLDLNMESSLIDMIGCRDAEVGTPDTYYTLDDSPSNSQLSAPDKEQMKESQGASQGLGNQSSQGSNQSSFLTQGLTSQTSQDNGQANNAWTDYCGHPSDPVSKIIIRFPNNTREQVELPCTSQLKALIVYCSGHGFPENKYELVTNYPRRKLSQMPSSISLSEAGLHPQETVFVQDL